MSNERSPRTWGDVIRERIEKYGEDGWEKRERYLIELAKSYIKKGIIDSPNPGTYLWLVGEEIELTANEASAHFQKYGNLEGFGRSVAKTILNAPDIKRVLWEVNNSEEAKAYYNSRYDD